MKYGHFDDKAKEYVITSPQTPLPWINYLGCEDFFTLLSNTCGGYCFYKDAKLLRLTRYRYNNTPLDSNGLYYYIKEGDTVWNPGWQPCQTPLDDYQCRHGLGYSVISGTKNELQTTVTAFVPIGDSCLLNHVTFRNLSDHSKTFTCTSYVEFCLWNAMDDMTNFQRNFSTGEVEVDEARSRIYHKTEYRERRNHYAVYSVNAPNCGFDTDRDTFLGTYGSPALPKAVKEDRSGNSLASGWAPVGSFRTEFTLQPGQEQSLIFLLGYCENPVDQKWDGPQCIRKAPADQLIEKYKTDEQIASALDKLKEYWNHLLSAYTLESGDERLDRMVNIWNQYQCMATFNMSRSASYYESGTGRGMGFRDSCQDLLGFVHLIPEAARQRILDIAATQFADGSAYHQYQPLTKKGNSDIGSGFNDDPLWLIAGTAAYIKETGDYGILNEMVTFDCDKSNTASLMEHLHRSFQYTSTHLGPHNLPLIGRADWNDCLNLNCFSNTPGESFQTTGASAGPVAESVFIAGMFVKYGHDYVGICQHLGLDARAADAAHQVNKMEQAVLSFGWDGDWFLRAYDANGNKVGSRECKEGQIFIEPQGFCCMAGIGVREGMAEKALRSVESMMDTKYGIVLLTPAYTSYHRELGEISTYPQGYKENGGIFCHNNPWISIAETVLGNGNRAFDTYRKICPAYLEDISEIHRTEPYVYSQMIAGKEAPRHGEAKNSWLTGTAAWTFTSISQYILGIRPEFDGLCIDPCIPQDMKGFHITRRFRGATYDITVKNPYHLQKGLSSLKVNGETVKGNVIAYHEGTDFYKVEAIL